MQSLRMVLGYFFVFIAVSPLNTFASLSAEDQTAFKAAGFTLKRLSEITPKDDSVADFAEKVRSFYNKEQEFENKAQDVYLVTDYTKALSKTSVNYGPAKTDKFDTLILSRYKDEIQKKALIGSSPQSQLQGVLEAWIVKGFSSHAIVPTNGGLVLWIDPTVSKGQMAGQWNAHSLEILVGTEKSQDILPHQISSLNFLVHFCNDSGANIQFCHSHGEARGSLQEGTVSNVDEVRTSLKLSKHAEGGPQVAIPLDEAKNNQEQGPVFKNCVIL